MIPPLAVTPGEPGGIGPDLCIQAACDGTFRGVVIADPLLMQRRIQQLGLPIHLASVDDYDPNRTQGVLYVDPVACAIPDQAPGRLHPENARYVLSCLDQAMQGIAAGQYRGLVTGPVHKANIRDGGFRQFTGHTEYLRDAYGLNEVVMMLASPRYRVALVTTHLPLREVPDAITQARVETTLEIVIDAFTTVYGKPHPKVAVLGLNPHAGESGHLGTEDDAQVRPAIAAVQARHPAAQCSGPWPADTAFTAPLRESVDCFLAMYHDQGLPIVKADGFGDSVNVTLGLPIVRTSVDHGTALDLAGTGRASTGGLVAALDEADRLTGVRR
ncbi:MAG: 4-hydroxythreonine-4-phosphate dehydrogenase PdxA [Litorivicinaceae bacterium]